MGGLICQVAQVGVDQLTCPHHESGGVQCEVIGSHDRHRVGDHTIQHYHWGNGWSCTNIENTVRKLNESMEQFSQELADGWGDADAGRDWHHPVGGDYGTEVSPS